MSRLRTLAAATAAFLSVLVGVHAVAQPPAAPRLATTLKPVAAFSRIADRRARSLALFAEVGKVVQHPRCLNCHPATERPTQTEAMHPHMPMVVRGDGGMGAPGLRCIACHHDRNVDSAGVPGNPKWSLAPVEMAWQGRTLGQICQQLKDPARNGGKTMPQMIDHMAHDELVGWGWHPGGKRVPAPGTQAQFGALFKAWAGSGAYCPA